MRSRLAAEVDAAEVAYQRQRYREYLDATAQQRVAEYQAKLQAGEAAGEAAGRARKAEAAAAARKARAAAGTVPYAGEIPASCDEYSGNRQIGCALLLEEGFTIDQMVCLDKLWTKESGWNHKASNPSTGAYGIPQALPGSKMGSIADDWQTNPATQIKWGLGYIEDRYETPCKAWAYMQDVGWY